MGADVKSVVFTPPDINNYFFDNAATHYALQNS